MRPNTGIKFTLGGLILKLIFIPLQGIGEELVFRAFLMVGFGFGVITAEQTPGGVLFNLGFKVLYLIVIFYTAEKLN